MKKFALFALLAFLALAVAPVHAQAAAPPTMTLTWSNSSCTASAACTAQVYRTSIAAPATTCPAFSTSAYTAIATSVAQNTTAGTYTDATVPTNVTVCYVITDTFVSGGPPSGPSNIFQMAIPALSPGAPSVLIGVYVP